MSRHAAFLRGMNVGGHRITNDQLRVLFATMGFRDVHTFRASGNVVFASDVGPPAEMASRIQRELERSLGYAVPTFLRTEEEIRSIAGAQPFDLDLLESSAGKLQVGMLPARPSARARRDVLALASDHDRLAISAGELYWLPSGGILDSALDLKAIGRLLGAMTMRTKNTIEQLSDKYFAT
jgi:uncharacterized protein (DUF1697 family)